MLVLGLGSSGFCESPEAGGFASACWGICGFSCGWVSVWFAAGGSGSCAAAWPTTATDSPPASNKRIPTFFFTLDLSGRIVWPALYPLILSGRQSKHAAARRGVRIHLNFNFAAHSSIACRLFAHTKFRGIAAAMALLPSGPPSRSPSAREETCRFALHSPEVFKENSLP